MLEKSTPTRITIFLLLLTLTVSPALATGEADSIRKILPTLKGRERLSALGSLRNLVHCTDNMEEELQCIRDYLEEAERQNDVESIGDALLCRIYCFENYEKGDSIRKYLPGSIEELRAHKAWDWMYTCWDAGVQYDLYHDRLESALREARKMYEDAKATGSNYGKGVALYDLGTIYQAIGRTREAADALRKSVETLRGEDNITTILSAYNYLCASLDGLGEYEESLRLTKEWESVISDYEAKATSIGYTVTMEVKRLYNELAACVAETGLGNYRKAGQHLMKAQEYARGRSESAQYKLRLTECRYYGAIGDYDRAIEAGEKNARMLRELGDSVSLTTMETQLADVYFKAKRYQDAARIYRELLPVSEKLREEELSRRLDELRTLYEVDTLRLESDANRTRLAAVIVIGILLLLTLIISIIYLVRLRKKNRVFYDIIQRHETIEKIMTTAEDKETEDSAGNDENWLFNVVRSLMETGEMYKDPALNRESLAIAAGSNTVYLAEAIKRNTGQTVSEFITGYRLAHAARMLSEKPKAGIGEVETESGFNSRSTFSRLFRLRYGMSPTEYRAVSKGKKPQA